MRSRRDSGRPLAKPTAPCVKERVESDDRIDYDGLTAYSEGVVGHTGDGARDLVFIDRFSCSVFEHL